jgi:hypothetical protein
MRIGVITLTLAFAMAFAFVILTAFPPSSEAGACPDQDSDTVCDPDDNCLTLANTSQTDSNTDGYGNRCDPDMDNNSAIGASDYSLFKQTFTKMTGDVGFNPDADFDEPVNGAVGASDYSIFKQFFTGVPGPSGKSCAGSIPCP